jgi:hypothetical protein
MQLGSRLPSTVTHRSEQRYGCIGEASKMLN